MEFNQAIGLVRTMIASGVQVDDAIDNPVIPLEYREKIRQNLQQEDNIILEPPRVLVSRRDNDWLIQFDRSNWYYWLTLRNYLLSYRNWPMASVRSLDDITNRILSQLSNPTSEEFNIRGLVIGYVQSGKTANYTGLIAKAADVGYRLIIILSGIDNGLRRQTQIRLDKELVGYPNNPIGAVPLPPMGKQWHQFTTEDLNGDFRPGFANYGALQGTEPVLLVLKKNGSVLRRLLSWLDNAPEEIRRTLPVLLIDDEADQASIDTRGTYIAENEQIPEDYEDPSVINLLIRSLLQKFRKKCYVAYTATPFANILIPHDNYNPNLENDLYPKDFIIDLPKPDAYFGAEELFGRFDPVNNDISGLDIVRSIPQNELDDLRHQNLLPPSLDLALVDFILAGASRIQRGQGDFPSTMLLHGSQLIVRQMQMKELVDQRFSELRDEWRYQRSHGIRERFIERWENEFRPITNSINPSYDCQFSKIEPNISPFFESIQVKVINSSTGELLDYENEPSIKAIAVGGNRLSRGLTLEGLLVSYFFRSTTMYDTLMQMGRWFGFRKGYEDLTRIYMTSEIAGWFSDLAFVEHELREDIKVYEAYDLTPAEFGTRIVKHPSMLVTSRLKQRFARTITVEQSYSAQVLQTIRFPFQDANALKQLLQSNIDSSKKFLLSLNQPLRIEQGFIWKDIAPEKIIDFLGSYSIDPTVKNLSMSLIVKYILNQNQYGELTNWSVVVRGRQTLDPVLGEYDLGEYGKINMISRTRLAGDKDSLGVITSPDDEYIDFSAEQVRHIDDLLTSTNINQGRNPASRLVRDPSSGLLLIYPISKFSGYATEPRYSRKPIYDDPNNPNNLDVLGWAISFPKTLREQVLKGEYVIGSVDWRAL